MQRSKSMKWRANMKALHARRTWDSACQSDARQNTHRASCGKEHCGKNKTSRRRDVAGESRDAGEPSLFSFAPSCSYASGLMSLNSDFCRDAKRTIWNLQESKSSCCGPWPGLCSTDAHIVNISHQKAQSIASRPKCRWIYFTYYHN